MPLSLRFTLSTSSACCCGVRLRWMTPSPPCRASAIASSLSVTVSIAALRTGILRRRRSCNRTPMFTSEGRTSAYPGTNNTSSKVSASIANRSGRPRSAPLLGSTIACLCTSRGMPFMDHPSGFATIACRVANPYIRFFNCTNHTGRCANECNSYSRRQPIRRASSASTASHPIPCSANRTML